LNVLVEKSKEVLYSVLPITFIVLILNFTIVPLEGHIIIRFLVGALFIFIGLTIFLLGVDIGITPVGTLMGSSLTKSNKVWIVGVGGLILGLFISIAEPDLHILAGQVEAVTTGVIPKFFIVLIVSLGVAAMIGLGLIRIVFNVSLRKFFAASYLLILVLGIFTSPGFLAIAFDSSGATTGALTVPFMLALALGVSSMKKDSKESESDSFGLVGIASAGAIMAVMVMSIIKRTHQISGSLESSITYSDSILGPFFQMIPTIAFESFIALAPLLLIFIVFQRISFKLNKKSYNRILKGFLYTHVGLTVFLVGVNAGFMDVGSEVGMRIASIDNKVYVIIVGFVLGLVTILAEPAVHVLTHQIEDVTSGYVKRRAVFASLCLGVGLAVAMAVVRIIVPEIQLWHFLLPGYIISISMMFIVPELFIGMAFDSGGVASGPMTATFILAFTQGVAKSIDSADALADGFGMIAMVAMTPIIALQTLGLIFKIKSRKGGLQNDGDK